jgi:flavorubredoxin
MTPHVHHWDSMMIFEENSKSLFTSDLFIQPGFNKPVISEDLSDSMIALYQAVGIFASEKPVRITSKRLEKLNPKMIYPMHGSCIDGSVFSNYVNSIMSNDFAYSGKLLGQNMEYEVT